MALKYEIGDIVSVDFRPAGYINEAYIVGQIQWGDEDLYDIGIFMFGKDDAILYRIPERFIVEVNGRRGELRIVKDWRNSESRPVVD